MKDSQGMQMPIEGLPNGYEGLIFVVDPKLEPGIYSPMNELIDPGSTAHGSENETIWAFVWPIDERYKCCGRFSFDYLSDSIIPDIADVLPDHQKRGIASSVYRFIKGVTELEIIPSQVQTKEARALWKSLAPDTGYL